MYTKRNYNKFIVLLFILLLSIAFLCSCSSSNKNSGELENIINNVNDYTAFFKANNTSTEVVEDEEGNYLKVCWENNMNTLLDVEEVISESELKELYQKAVEMETLMRDEIYRRNME